jgi:hypothetical protein
MAKNSPWRQAQRKEDFKEFSDMLNSFGYLVEDMYFHRFTEEEAGILIKAIEILENFQKVLEKRIKDGE